MLCAGLEQFEADELLALLANLGAQQQAVLAAIAERQQHHVQKAAGRGQSAAGPFQFTPAALPVRRQAFDISVAAGDAASAAQQQNSYQP